MRPLAMCIYWFKYTLVVFKSSGPSRKQPSLCHFQQLISQLELVLVIVHAPFRHHLGLLNTLYDRVRLALVLVQSHLQACNVWQT